jgi:CubicO group peptidase (beta-lactamase class C family)
MVSMFGQTKSIESQLIQKSKELIEKNIEANNIVGFSAAIIAGDSIIWKNSFGYADKANNVPMTENTTVNIASVTKTFTALSIMQLHENNKININQPLQKYFTLFKPKTNHIDLNLVTPKNVIMHCSGIQNDIFKNAEFNTGEYTDIVDYINDTYLMYPPGVVSLYSNSGYNILGHTIKYLTKNDYKDYVKTHILNPLDMNNTGFITDSLKNRTKIYSKGNEVPEYALRDIASGGIYSSIADMSKYAIALIAAYKGKDSTIIKQKTIQQMFSLQNDKLLIETNKKGLGWFMFKNDSALAVFHSGSAGIAHAKLLIIPEKEIAIIALTNSSEGNHLAEKLCFNALGYYQLSVGDIVPKTHFVNPLNNGHITVEANLLKQYIGNYAELTSYTNISLQDGKLKLTKHGKRFDLEPISDSIFVPIQINNKGNISENHERYYFKSINEHLFLFHYNQGKEYSLGYKLNPVNKNNWNSRLGNYEHFGYQMKAGDTKFNAATLTLDSQGVLFLTISTSGGDMPLPLNVINEDYLVTGGVNTSLGFNVVFKSDEKYDILDFAGLTFRKEE